MLDLMIDIPKKGNNDHSDGFQIRRTAAECSVSLLTSLDTAGALVSVMEKGYTPNETEVIAVEDIR